MHFEESREEALSQLADCIIQGNQEETGQEQISENPYQDGEVNYDVALSVKSDPEVL